MSFEAPHLVFQKVEGGSWAAVAVESRVRVQRRFPNVAACTNVFRAIRSTFFCG